MVSYDCNKIFSSFRDIYVGSLPRFPGAKSHHARGNSINKLVNMLLFRVIVR